MQSGRVVAIHTAPEKGAPMASLDAVEAVAGRGLAGDRYAGGVGTYSGSRRPDAERAVTLFEVEALAAVRDEHGIELRGAQTRRNLVTSGVALDSLVGTTFRIGAAVLRGVEVAPPCAYLEAQTAPGVLRALTGRGGIRAEILTGGTIRVGDAITPDPLDSTSAGSQTRGPRG